MTSAPPRVHGVASLLEPAAAARVRALWELAERRLGVTGVRVMPWPHFSCHVSAGYDRPALERALVEFAEERASFAIRTTGLAMFDPPWPTYYIAIERSAELAEFHRRVWEIAERHSRALDSPVAASRYYRPETWVPHITLAHGEERKGVPLSSDAVAKLGVLFGAHELAWNVRVDNLALVIDDGVEQRPVRAFPLRPR